MSDEITEEMIDAGLSVIIEFGIGGNVNLLRELAATIFKSMSERKS